MAVRVEQQSDPLTCSPAPPPWTEGQGRRRGYFGPPGLPQGKPPRGPAPPRSAPRLGGRKFTSGGFENRFLVSRVVVLNRKEDFTEFLLLIHE
jgi:hypothetical protein